MDRKFGFRTFRGRKSIQILEGIYAHIENNVSMLPGRGRFVQSVEINYHIFV